MRNAQTGATGEAMPTAVPDGVTLWCDVPGASPPGPDLDDRIEVVQLATADSSEVATAVTRLAKLGLANATPGGVILTEADLRSFITLLECLEERARAAHAGAMDVALARLQQVG